MSELKYCNHRWTAPRGDVPVSADVLHVCALVADHSEPHYCPCRAYLPLEDTANGRDRSGN